MKPILKLKATKVFTTFINKQPSELASLMQLFGKISDEVEMGVRLENVAERFYHLHNTMSDTKDIYQVTRQVVQQMESDRKLSPLAPINFPIRTNESVSLYQDPASLITYPQPIEQYTMQESFQIPHQPIMPELITHSSVTNFTPMEYQTFNNESLYNDQQWFTNFNDGFNMLPFSPDMFMDYNEQYNMNPNNLGLVNFTQEPLCSFEPVIVNEPPEVTPNPPPEVIDPPHRKSPPIKTEFKPTKRKKTRAKSIPSPDQDNEQPEECQNCHVKSTPLWRYSADGSRLCNACGLYYKLHKSHRPVNAKTVKSNYKPRQLECVDCGSLETSLWRKKPGTDQPICNSCGLYRRIKHEKRPSHLYNGSIKKRQRNYRQQSCSGSQLDSKPGSPDPPSTTKETWSTHQPILSYLDPTFLSNHSTSGSQNYS